MPAAEKGLHFNTGPFSWGYIIPREMRIVDPPIPDTCWLRYFFFFQITDVLLRTACLQAEKDLIEPTFHAHISGYLLITAFFFTNLQYFLRNADPSIPNTCLLLQFLGQRMWRVFFLIWVTPEKSQFFKMYFWYVFNIKIITLSKFHNPMCWNDWDFNKTLKYIEKKRKMAEKSERSMFYLKLVKCVHNI